MNQEVKRAIANIRRRQTEINRKFGKQDDDGPLYDRSRRARQERSSLALGVDELVEDFDDDGDFLQSS